MQTYWNETVKTMDNMPDNDEIAAYVEGIADKESTRRVLRAALLQPALRATIESLTATDRAHDNAYRGTGGDSGSRPNAAFAARSEKLKTTMRDAVRSVAAEGPAAVATKGLRVSVSELASRVLRVGRQLLTLPCLAPATASSASDLSLRRQTVQTGDGVRIEFQQLPGTPPYRLRVFVDASHLQYDAGSAPNAARPTTGEGPYNMAYLTLEDSRGSTDETTPDRHVLIVTLNPEGRGFGDFVVGGEGEHAFAAPAGACRLVSATLSCLP